MFLSCYRGADYLTQRPDWDGKTLIVSGTSQGGYQTLVTAGLHPKVTAAMALVPAGCDHTGLLAERAPGWPNWNLNTGRTDAREALEASRYYDAVNFAARIRCPLLVGVGLIDETCPPAGVIAAFNQTHGPRELVVLPRSNHHGDGNAQAAYYARSAAWRTAIRQGKSPGVQP